MSKIVYAELQTRNFTFRALGRSVQEVQTQLKSTFEAHIKRTDGWLTWDEVAEEVYIHETAESAGWVR